MIAERKLNGIWNVERLLQGLLCFVDDRGRIVDMNLSDDSPYGIKVRRFVAAMKAYGKEQSFSWVMTTTSRLQKWNYCYLAIQTGRIENWRT